MAAKGREDGSRRSPRGSPQRRGVATFTGLPGTSTYIDSGPGASGFIKGSVARLSRPLPGVQELTEGRTDFFAELARSVGSEIQRLVRYTLMGYTTPLTEEVEMRAQADIDNGLSRILELLAAYVDDVAVASQELWPKLDAASLGEHMLSRQLDEAVAQAQRLEEELEKKEKDIRKSSLLMRQMRAFYTSDLENQRDRFRTTLLNSLPELTDSAMAGIMDHLASVNMFDPKDFVDVETASLLQLHRATMEKDFALEREALGSRIQKETEARINYERLYQAENAKVQWLTSGIEKLKANGIVAVEALAAPVDGALHPPTMPGIDAPQDGTLSIDVLDSPSLQDRNTSGLRREMMKVQQDIAEMKRRESVIAHVVGDLNDLVNRQFDMANEYHGSKEHDLIASVIGEFPAKVGEIQMVLAGKLSDDGRGSASPVSPSSAREEASPEAKISQLQIQTKVLKTEKEVLKLHLQDAREKLAAAEHAAGTHHTSAAPAVPGREEPSSAHEAPEVVQEQEAEVEAKPSEPKKSATKLSEELVRHPSFDEDNLRDARASLASPAPSTRRFSRRSFAAVSELGGEAELQTFEALPPQTRKRSSIKARPLLADVGAQTEEPADTAATKYPPGPLEPSLPPVPQDERSETDDAAGAEDEEAAAPRFATQGSQTGEDDARDPSGPHNTQLEFQLVEHFSSRRSPRGRSPTAGRIAIGAEDDLHVDVSPSSRPTRRERRTFASGSQSPRGAASPWAGEAAALPLVPEVVSRGTSPIVLSRGTSPESSGGGELSGEEPATLRVDPQPAGSTASSLQAPRQAHGLVPTPRGSRAASRTPRASKTVPLELEEDGSAALQGFVVSRAVEERRLPRMTRQNGDFPPSGPPQDDEPPTPSVGVSAPTEPPPPGPAEPPPRTSSPAALPAGLAALGAPEPPPSPRLEPHLAEASPASRSPSAQQRESSEQGTEGSSAEEGGEEEEEKEEEEEEEASAAVDAWEEEGSWPGAAEAAVHDGEPEPTREQLEEELEDVRDNLREAVFERDYLHAQLGLAREAAVQAKSEHSQLWRRQSAWLGKCKRVLEGADVGLRLPIPAALLEPQCPPDALEEVFRAELAGDGQLVDEDELQHRLKKSGEKALVAAYVEAATAAEGQRRQAAAMAESLAPFRELAMTSRRTSLRPAHQQPSMAASPRSQASQRSQDDLGGGASPRRGTAPNLIPVGDDDAQDRTPRRGTASAVLMRVGARKSTRFMQATETDFVRPMESLAERTAAQYAAQRFVGRASQESSFVRTATTRNSQTSFDASLAGLDEHLVQDAAAACDYLDYVDKRWSWHPAPELGSRTPEHSDASSGSPPGSRTLSGWARQLDQLEATMPPVLGLDSDTGDASDRRSSHGFSGAWQREGASQMLGRSASAPACAAEDVSLCHVCVRRLRRRTPAAGGPGAAPPEAEAALELARPGAEDPHDMWPSRAASQQAGTSPLAASQQTFAAGTLKAVEDAASTLGGLSAITTAAFTERPVTAATGERATTASTIDAFRAGTADTVRQSADQHLAEEASSGLGDPSDGQESALDLQLAPVQRGTPPGTPVQVKPPSPLGGPSSPLAPLHDAPLLEPEPEMDSPEPEALCAHCGRCLGPLPAPVEADPSPPPAALARSPARTPEDRRPAAGSVPAPESAEDGSSPSPYAEGRAPAPQPAPASGDGGPAAPLAQPPAAPLAQSLFGEATPSAAHPPRTTMVDAKQQSKTRPPNPSPPPLPAAGSAHCDRKPSRLLGHTESEAMEKPRALTEAGAQTIPRPLVEQGAQTYISRIADLLEEGADTSKVVGTQTDSPDVMQVEISKRLAWARAQRQETLHQILGTGGASGGHVEYPRESAEADQLVVELAKLGMDRRALKSLVEPIEVVDVAVQSGVEVAGSLDPIFRWLKLNLLQRQNAWLYCLPSEVSALEGFPNIPGARLEKLLVDFERFLEEILSRPLPAKSAARSALRARYRARSDSPCSRRNRSGSPPPGRGSLLGGRESWRRSNAVEPYEYPVGFLSSGFDGEQEVANMVLVPDTTAPPPIGKGLCRGRAENAPIQSPWRWERSGDAANPWGFPMFASPEAPPDQPPKKAKVPRTVEEVLGVPLPPSAFAAKPGAAGLDPDPLCLAWAAENGLILPAGAQKLFPPDVPYPTRAAKALAAVPEIYRPTMRPPPAKAQLQFVQFDGAASKLQTHEFVGRKVGDMANSNPTPFGKLQVRESVGRKAGDMSISNSVSKVGDMSDTGRTTAPAQTPRNPASSPLSSPLDATGRGPEELLPGGGDDRTGRLRELLDVLRRAAARSLLEGLRPLRAPAVQLQAPAAQPSRAGPAGARPVRSLGPTRPAPAAALAAPPGSARRPAQQAAAPSPLPRRQPASGQAAASEQPRAPEAPASARGASRRLGAREEAPTLPRAAALEEMAAKMPVDGGSAPYVGCVAWSYGAGTAGADSDVPPADTSAAEAPEQDRALATASMDSSAHGAADAAAGGHRPDPANLPRLSAWRKLDAPLQASPADMAAGGWLPRLRPDIQDADAALPQPTPPRPVSRGSSGRPGSRSSRRAMTPKEEWQRWSGGGAPA